MRLTIESMIVSVGCCVAIAGLIMLDRQAEQREEAVGRAIVTITSGWSEWPIEPAYPLCERDPTGNYHLVTPCQNSWGLIYYRNAWMPKRWGPTQRKEM